MTELDFRDHAPKYRDYLDQCKENGSLKSNTVEKRKLMIDEFIEHCQKYDVTIDTSEFYDSVDEISAYFERDDITVHGTKVSAIRHFLQYIMNQVDTRTEDELDNIRDKIKMGKLSDKNEDIGKSDPKDREEKILSDEEIRRAKKAGSDQAALLIDLMLDSAARPGEIVAFRPADIDFDEGTFHIKATWSDAEGFIQEVPKHEGFRKVKLRKETLKRLREYIDENDVDEDEPVFGSYRRAVYDPLKEAFTHAQVRVDNEGDTTNFTPHWLRHNAITKLIHEKDNSKEKVQHYAGHNQISTTEIYEHVDDSEVVDVDLE